MTDLAPQGGVPGQRRFAAVGSAAAQYALVMNEWKNVVIDYEEQALNTAQADFNYHDAKRTYVKREQAANPKLTSAKANDWAEAEDEISTLKLEHLLEDARLDAMQKKLRWFEAESKRLQSMNTNEREERKLDGIHQPG
jgi:hypothetical protein